MHTPVPVVFNDITPAHFAALEKSAQNMGLSVVGTSGRTQKDGCDVEWSYDAEKQIFAYTIIQSPFWMPVSILEKHFASLVEETAPVETEDASKNPVAMPVIPTGPVVTDPVNTSGPSTPITPPVSK